jgi:hypothetical protein
VERGELGGSLEAFREVDFIAAPAAEVAGAHLRGNVLEMNPALLQNQFVQVALPIMFTVLIAAWMNGKGLDGVKGRLDGIVARLGRIEGKPEGHD